MDPAVTLWVLDLDSPTQDCARAWSLLDAGEQARAQRFMRETDRRRFILRRAALREILAQHTGLPPNALPFTHNPFERPFLAGVELDFNTSHSDGLAVIAITRSGRVGIDVERRLHDAIDPAILQPHLSPAAYAAFLQDPPARREHSFYAWWTRVEAFAKARGTGIVMQAPPPLDGHPDDTRSRVLPDDHGHPQTWHPTPLTLSPRHAATLVVSDTPRPVSIKQWG
ncbi:4'-phosphopantetheinyl transferase superfamily protein [Zoogloea sp.]|uniref:4'-phosphopantetheinyl transferase family protein n=1 Tax=Zoogloea sp. TaxID=49181 RepID=UPI0035AFA4EC